ncbi:PREDICTED: TRAF3-interacting protein 1-like [Eufriesea mexicana]|uniref:TRAF3-interacting protein 1-like n=1 Tax=Eufriesea mexicana TaxID=516756 RepID=UPI00083C5420|nr:PREDICTED: TRAF3-interacting protein 1-like [Eufriesea mexicana]
MNRSNERVSRRWSMPEPSCKTDSSNTEESSSLTDSTQYSPYVQHTSTPVRPRWSNLEEINRSRRSQQKIDDTEEASSDKRRRLKRIQRHKEHVVREKYQDDHERTTERQKDRHNRRDKRRDSRRSEGTVNKIQEDTSSLESSEKSYGESELERSKRRKRNLTGDNELPITEILKRSQENAKTKYEHQTPFPVLTTDKIYVQHRGGFSAIKINKKKDPSSEKKIERESSVDNVEGQNSPLIKVAIMVQQFAKNTGFLYQGLLGGMALMHFIIIYAFFNNTTEFLIKYSTTGEIYTNIFSFLVAMCIVSTFDKFDLARFDMEHLRELYFDYNRAVIAVPLYLIVFCLHQVGAGTDNHINLIHYYNFNDSICQNDTNVQSLLDDLNSWQKITMSKDLLAVFAWLFVSLGTKDDSFLMYLQSMEKYASDIESSSR